MITRRATMAGLLASPFTGRRASALGLSGGPDAYVAMAGVSALTEGNGGGVVNILFTPWCSAIPELFAASRKVLQTLTLRWIPYSGGLPEGREATEILLRNPDPLLIPASFVVIGRAAGREQPTPLCDHQDHLVSRMIEPLIVRDTGGAMKVPTLVYRMNDERVRIIPGALREEEFDMLADFAS